MTPLVHRPYQPGNPDTWTCGPWFISRERFRGVTGWYVWHVGGRRMSGAAALDPATRGFGSMEAAVAFVRGETGEVA